MTASEEPLLKLMHDFSRQLDSRVSLLKSAVKYGSQLEGWLKGELLHFFDLALPERIVVSLDREVRVTAGSRQRCDFRIGLSSSPNKQYWLELKHWLIGHQSGVNYNANFYFSDPTGFVGDVRKLQSIPNARKFAVILATASPDESSWRDGIAKFNAKFAPLRVRSLTSPTQYRPEYFLGVLGV